MAPLHAPTPEADGEAGLDRSIGHIFRQTRDLSAEQVERILDHQRRHGVRFGEAAVALGLVTPDDVLFALAQQFHYPVAPSEQRARSPALVALVEPFSACAEAFRDIRSQLLMRLFVDGEARRALAVVSPDAGDGRSYVAANLAIALAQLGGRTLLLDADLRGPAQHALFQLDAAAGLSSILAGRAESNAIQPVSGVPSLFVLPVGVVPPNPLELVERPAFARLLRDLAGSFDHVVVDTPAAGLGADAAVVAARCGAALVVARRHASRIGALQSLVDGVGGQARAHVVGVVVNEH